MLPATISVGILQDDRGEIINVAEGEFKSVQIITSKKDSIRSCHFHKQGGHWLYVLSGRMLYMEMPVTSDPNPGWTLMTEVRAGERVWSGPMMVHKVRFLEDTVLVSCAIGKLDTETYEADTVRVSL